VLYPVPIHLQPGYKDRVEIGAGGMEVTETICRQILCLPIYPELTDEQIGEIIGCIRDFFTGKAD